MNESSETVITQENVIKSTSYSSLNSRKEFLFGLVSTLPLGPIWLLLSSTQPTILGGPYFLKYGMASSAILSAALPSIPFVLFGMWRWQKTKHINFLIGLLLGIPFWIISTVILLIIVAGLAGAFV